MLDIRRRLRSLAAREGADPWFILPVCAAMVADAATTLAFQAAPTAVIIPVIR